MSVVEIKCPRCGSPSNLQSSKTNEYACSNCGTVFRFVDQTRRVVATDILIRNCSHCGKPLEAGKGFKCTRCGGEFFCDSCVDEVQGKYVCADCLITSGENCQFCKKYAIYKCLKCGRRACKMHPHNHFLHNRKYIKGGYEHVDHFVRYCSTCHGYVCLDCEQMVGFFFQTIVCPKCRSQLGEYKPW